MSRSIKHVLMITVIIVAVFIAAALTPAEIKVSEQKNTAVVNIAKVDFENNTVHAGGRMIADNEIPLAAEPSDASVNMQAWWIIVTAAAVISGIVIFEDLKDRKVLAVLGRSNPDL